jgi:hypothetical protein
VSTTRFLDYEIALLLAQYGREATLAAMARHIGDSQAELEKILDDIGREKPKAQRKPKPPISDPVEVAVAAHPDKAKYLQAAAARFQNRSFLPELRDVKRLFDQHGHNLGRPKSRQECLPKVLNLLADLGDPELESLLANHESRGYSSLSVISDEILRREK